MNAKKQFTPALGYDLLTVWYDTTIRLTMPEPKFRGLLVEQLDPQAGEKILEFGFGTGQNLLLVKKRCPETNLHGLDIDPKVWEIARRKLQKQRVFVPLDLYDDWMFPYTTSKFDKVFSCLVFHQLDMDAKFASLGEIHRVLKKGGRLVIADWGEAANQRMRLAFGLVQLLDGFKTTADNVRGRLPELIRETGFREVRTSGSINTRIGTLSYFTAVK